VGKKFESRSYDDANSVENCKLLKILGTAATGSPVDVAMAVEMGFKEPKNLKVQILGFKNILQKNF